MIKKILPGLLICLSFTCNVWAQSYFDQHISNNNDTTIDEGEVTLAVHPLDSSKLVITYIEKDTNIFKCPIYYSSNGGQSWTNSTFETNPIGISDFPGTISKGSIDPSFAWSKSGRLYFSWIFGAETGDSLLISLNYAYSDDNGYSWIVPPGPLHIIAAGICDSTITVVYNYMDGIVDRPWLAVDNSNGIYQDRLYCSFLLLPDSAHPQNDGFCVKSKDATATSFSSAVNVFNSLAQFGNVEVDKNGKVHVSFADINTDKIMHAFSVDGGATFSAPVVAGSGSNLIGNFQIHDCENSAPNLISDGSANLHLVYSSFPAAGGVESFYARSTTGGSSWTSILLNGLFGNRTLMPVISSFGNNVTISATVIDNNDSARYYEINSTDNGDTWNAPLLLSSSPTYYPGYNVSNPFFGHYNRSISTYCNTYTGWSDGRNAQGPKVYFSRTNYCTTGFSELTSINNTLQLESVYPVPANKFINLTFSNNGKRANIDISLMDISGKTILHRQATVHTGDDIISLLLPKMSPGFYVISLKNKGDIIATRQVIIQ